MSFEFIPFMCGAGFLVLPASHPVYLDGEACTAKAMEPGESGRVYLANGSVEVLKLHLDDVTSALPSSP